MDKRREFDAEDDDSVGESDEARRLLSLHSLGILDSEPNPMLDSIVKAAAGLFHAPIALVTLVDKNRQWFKASLGLSGPLEGVTETPRDMAFCHFTITDSEVMTVQEPAKDPRFADNPLVTGEAGIRFYSGAPLRLPGGEHIGSLCVLDTVENTSGAEQDIALQALAKVVVDLLMAESELADGEGNKFPVKPEVDDVKAVILEAAYAAMATEGAPAFSVRKVARQAGVSLGHLQHYFPDKQSLLAAIINGLSERFKFLYNDDVRSMPNAVDRLTYCAIGILNDAQNPRVNQLMQEIWALSGRDKILADTIHQIYVRIFNELSALLIEANPDLDDRESELRAATCISLLTGSFLLERLDLVDGYRDRILEKIVSLPFSRPTS
ncbi:MAG: TetR family transcriptional regulator [Pseudomonadota bacterium]